jgi:predicted RNA-binding protein
MEELLTAQYGAFILNDTNEKEGQFLGIYVLEDTVFARIEADGVTATDVKANYIAATGTAVKAGALITPLQGTNSEFSAVTLTSGSVVLIYADN